MGTLWLDCPTLTSVVALTTLKNCCGALVPTTALWTSSMVNRGMAAFSHVAPV